MKRYSSTMHGTIFFFSSNYNLFRSNEHNLTGNFMTQSTSIISFWNLHNLFIFLYSIVRISINFDSKFI